MAENCSGLSEVPGSRDKHRWHSFGIPSDYYSNVIWQGYETAGFETQFLEDAIEHAYQLVQKQEREGDFYQQSLFHMGGYDGMK